MVDIERRHWVSTLVGVLDTAFSLTDVEQTDVYFIVDRMLLNLGVPERGTPTAIPVEVLNEAANNFYSDALYSAADGKRPLREIRKVAPGEMTAPLDAWRTALEHMITDSYALEYKERIYLVAALDDLLSALRVGERAHVLLPESVLNIQVGS